MTHVSVLISKMQSTLTNSRWILPFALATALISSLTATARANPLADRSIDLSPMINVFSKVITATEDMEHIYIAIDWEADRLSWLLQEERVCRTPRGFVATAPDQLARQMYDVLEPGFERAYEDSSVRAQASAEFEAAAQALKASLSGRDVRVCRSSSIPAYSDGHLTYLVKVDGILSFSFELGRPD